MGEKKSTRFRNFATVIYPESAPDNVVGMISDLKVPAYLSPLHDRDFDPGGNPKKPHLHLLLTFDGVKSEDQAREIFDSLGAVGCEVVNSARGYARYLCHLDNPDKAQYDPDLVQCFSGADYRTLIGLPTDRRKAIREMKAYCVENEIYYLDELFDYAEQNREDWFIALCDNSAMVMSMYLKARGARRDREERVADDPRYFRRPHNR